MQKLNPLKSEINPPSLKMGTRANAEFNVEALLKGLFPATPAIDELHSSSLFAPVPAHVPPEALESFLRTLVTHSPQNATELQDENEFCTLSSECKTNRIQGSFDSVPAKPGSVGTDLESFDTLLDAEFVMDVTIPDGSKVEVGTAFTKVWRLKNCGAIPWPQLTKLAHIGGDVHGSNGTITLQLPEGGLPFNSEVDVYMELKAPESPGHYISCWHLKAPSGQSFGDTVWVLIETISLCDLRKVTCESKASYIDKELKEYPSDEPTIGNLVLKIVNEGKKGDMEGLGEVGLKTDCLSLNLTEEQGETDGFSLVEKLVEGLGGQCEATEEFELISPCLYEFPSSNMGIKQNSVKVELQQNNVSEHDFLGSTGWDDMLKDLEELGFSDTQDLNSEASIKRAVQELHGLEN